MKPIQNPSDIHVN